MREIPKLGILSFAVSASRKHILMLPVVLHVVNATAAIIVYYVGEIDLMTIKIKPIVYHLTLTIVPGHPIQMVEQEHWCHQAALTMIHSSKIHSHTRLLSQQRLPRMQVKWVQCRNFVESANLVVG